MSVKSSITISIPLERGDATEGEGIETTTTHQGGKAVPITNSPSLTPSLSVACMRAMLVAYALQHPFSMGEEKEEQETEKYRTQQEEMLLSKISTGLLERIWSKVAVKHWIIIA